MAIKYYDLIVIGGGSGGIAAANKAGALGKKVCLLEKTVLGGTCVNGGCVPKKLTWYASEFMSLTQVAKTYGFDLATPTFDFGRFVTVREKYISKLHQIYAKNLTKNHVDLIYGEATFIDAHTVRINNQDLSAKDIIIATGTHPAVPAIPGHEFAETSDDFFTWNSLPKKIAIVGGGYIAVELACMLQSLGSQVTVILRHDKPLRHFDHLIATQVKAAMNAAGITFIENDDVTEIINKDKQLFLELNKSRSHASYDAVLFAIGRTVNHSNLNLPAAKIAVDDKGFIKIDKYQTTTISHIYAIGDVTGKMALTPVAIAAGRRLIERLFGDDKTRFLDYENIPTVIFTHPPCGSIGLSEHAAAKKYGKDNIKVYQSKFKSMFYAFSKDAPLTLMKLVTLKPDEKVVGCHLIGLNADEILQGFAVAIKMGATKKQLDDTVAIHPTSAEELVTMR